MNVTTSHGFRWIHSDTELKTSVLKRLFRFPQGRSGPYFEGHSKYHAPYDRLWYGVAFSQWAGAWYPWMNTSHSVVRLSSPRSTKITEVFLRTRDGTTCQGHSWAPTELNCSSDTSTTSASSGGNPNRLDWRSVSLCKDAFFPHRVGIQSRI